MKEECKKIILDKFYLEKKDSDNSAKLSKSSTIKNNNKSSTFKRKFPDQNSISEIKLEENSNSVDKTYLSFLKKGQTQYLQTIEGNILTTNFSENKIKPDLNLNLTFKNDKFVIDEEQSKLGITFNANNSLSSFKSYGYISTEEKLKKLVKKATLKQFTLTRTVSIQNSVSYILIFRIFMEMTILRSKTISITQILSSRKRFLM